jgi:hypothetical protein
MPESFDLPVWYKGEEIFFPAELLPTGFTHKIKLTIQGTEILFEPDEERNYRAVVGEADRDKANKLDRELLAVIVETLHELFSD